MVDIKSASVLADFEVIEIFNESNPYPTLLWIDWATHMNGVINLKKRKVIFEKKVTTCSGTFRPCGRIVLHRASAWSREWQKFRHYLQDNLSRTRLGESYSEWQDFVGERKVLHLIFGWGNIMMAELITRGNHAHLQHDSKITALRDNRGKGPTYVWLVEKSGWFPKEVWKRITRTAAFWHSKMGTACYACKMVGYAWEKFWILL